MFCEGAKGGRKSKATKDSEENGKPAAKAKAKKDEVAEPEKKSKKRLLHHARAVEGAGAARSDEHQYPPGDSLGGVVGGWRRVGSEAVGGANGGQGSGSGAEWS